MSSARTYTLDDARSEINRLRSDVSAAACEARRANSRFASLESDLETTNQRVSHLVSDVSGLADDVASHRAHLYNLDTEIADLQTQQTADHRLIERNERMIAAIEDDIASLQEADEEAREQIAAVRQHAELLQREADLARRRIDAHDQHIQHLQAGVQQINHYLEAERQRQMAERAAKEKDLDAQAQLAANLRAQLDPARVRFFGAYSEYLTATTKLDQAEVNRQRGNREVALAQYQDGQSMLMKIARDIDERERAFENRRAQCQATLHQLQTELEMLNTPDMQTWYPAEWAQLQKRLQALQTSFQGKQYEAAGIEQVEVRLALEQMNNQGMQIYQDTRLLEKQLLETLAHEAERSARVREILRALRKMWDQKFPYTLRYLNETDPKSTVILETTRPDAPNVRVHLDLDRTVQFSWGGYEGMKCLEDVNQFEQVMRQVFHVTVDLKEPPVNVPGGKLPPDGGNLVVPKAGLVITPTQSTETRPTRQQQH